MLAGGVVLIGAGLVTGEATHFDPSAVSRTSLVGLAYLITLGSVVGYSAYTYLVTAATPAKLGTYAYVNPIIAVFLGWAIAGEPIGPMTIVAVAMIVAAVDGRFMSAPGRLVDLSHTITSGLVTYKGLPAPLICDYLSREASRSVYAEGTTFHIGRIDMVANTGTYLDSPFHRFETGTDISGLALTQVTGLDAVVVQATGRVVDRDAFAAVEVRDKAVLVHTGWSAHWATDRYFEGHPYLTGAAARDLRDRGAVLVGIDSLNIDDTADGTRPVHTTLLGANILIVEHLCALDQLPPAGFTFSAVPVKVAGLGTFPVRAFATL
jgi:kynurenine formamidase